MAVGGRTFRLAQLCTAFLGGHSLNGFSALTSVVYIETHAAASPPNPRAYKIYLNNARLGGTRRDLPALTSADLRRFKLT